MGLAGSSSATTIPAPPFSVCAVAEPSVKLINPPVRCLTNDRKGVARGAGFGCSRLPRCLLMVNTHSSV